MNTGLNPCFFRRSTVLFVVVMRPSSLPVLNQRRFKPRFRAALSRAARFCFSHC